jgi:hypothetical protein
VNIPFFTAEASLYKHNGNYRSAALSLRDGGVFPQACNYNCLVACEGGCPKIGDGSPPYVSIAVRACLAACRGKCGCLG